MDLRPIRNDADHQAALKAIEALMEAPEGGAEEARLDLLTTLVEAYEAKHHAIDLPDPIAAIRFMMEQKGLKPRDLEPAIGGRGRVSEILNRKRPLTLPMIRALSPLLSLPAEILIQEYQTANLAAA